MSGGTGVFWGGLGATPVVRAAYAGTILARVLTTYKLAEARRWLQRGVPDRSLSAVHERNARRVYDGVVRMQGLMIKVGQTIGSNPVGFPIEYVTILSRLQDAVPPRPWRQMRPQIERALGGRRVDEVFAEFDRRPVAAASLAQVYRARLKDGRLVAVKVLYPGIERLVQSDLRLLRVLLWLDGRVSGYPTRPIYDELAQNVPLEVNLVHEARAMEALAARLRDDPRVTVPAVVWELSSRRLLVMEWVDGIKITNVDALRAAGHDRQALSDLLLDTYCRQILVDGFFHADPHPGNLFALPGDRLAIVDFGLTKRLSPQFRDGLRLLVWAIFTGDVPVMVGAFDALGYKVTRGDDHAVYAATAEFFRTVTSPDTYEQGPGAMQAINDRWVQAVKQNPVVAIPGDTTLVWRVFALLMGVGATIGAKPAVVETVLRYSAPDGASPAAPERPDDWGATAGQ